MAFKDYPSNPVYQNVADDDWGSGLCCIFANALRERFGLPMQALMIVEADGAQTLLHAFAHLPDGRVADWRGIRTEEEMVASFRGSFSDEELAGIALAQFLPVRLEVLSVTLEELADLNPEDHQDTNAAHAFIDRHSSLFHDLAPAGDNDATGTRQSSRVARRQP